MRIQLTSDNKYTAIYFNQSTHLFEQFWYKESENMDDNEYMDIHEGWVKKLLVEKYQIYSFYLDNRENYFTMSPELQEWHAKNITEVVIANLPKPESLKVAIVVSEDFISQLGIEQTMEETNDATQMTRYFEDEEEAREWLSNAELQINLNQTPSADNGSKKENVYAKTNIADNKYYTSFFEPAFNAYEVVWNTESSEMSEDEYIDLNQKELDIVMDYEGVETAFFDIRDFSYEPFSEFHKWHIDTFVVKLVEENPGIKIGYLAKDEALNIGLQLIVQEIDNLEDSVKYFEDEVEARGWLLGE